MILNWIYNLLWHVSVPINFAEAVSPFDAFHSSLFFAFHVFHMLFCFILRVYWLSLSFNSSRCLLLSRRINWWTEWREKSSRQSRELEVFSFIPRLTVKIPKAFRTESHRIQFPHVYTSPDSRLKQWRDNVRQTMLFVFFCTPFFVCYVSAHDTLKWIKFKGITEKRLRWSFWHALVLVNNKDLLHRFLERVFFEEFRWRNSLWSRWSQWNWWKGMWGVFCTRVVFNEVESWGNFYKIIKNI